MLDGLRPLVERAGTQNVRIALETLLPAEELRDVIAQFGCPHVQACYDVGTARAAGRDVVAEIKLLADCLGQVQIKDRDRREPFPSVPLGAGMVNWRAVLDALRELRFAHWLVLDTPSGDQPLESASKNLQFLRPLLRNTHAAADPPDHRQGTMNDQHRTAIDTAAPLLLQSG
jgi:sugar phosphate isomerase/epimerase